MASEFETLTIEPRGNDYVLTRDNGAGGITQIILSETNVVFLGRLAPTVARKIVASKSPPGSDVSANVAAPAKDFSLNSDLHNELVLLRIRDEFDGEFDFFNAAPWGPSFGRAAHRMGD